MRHRQRFQITRANSAIASIYCVAHFFVIGQVVDGGHFCIVLVHGVHELFV